MQTLYMGRMGVASWPRERVAEVGLVWSVPSTADLSMCAWVWLVVGVCLLWSAPIMQAMEASEAASTSSLVVERYGYPDTFPDPVMLRGWLSAGQYDRLNQTLESLQAAVEADVRREEQLLAALRVFEVPDPALTPLYDPWVAQYPAHWAPYLARAHHFDGLARHARGTGYISDTSEAQLDKMGAALARSRSDFERALQISPKLLSAYRVLCRQRIRVGDQKAAEQIYRAGLEFFPTSFRLRSGYIGMLAPRWGGSFQAINQAVADAVPHVAENPKLKLLEGFLLLERARILRLRGNRELALSLLDQTVALGDLEDFFLARAAVRMTLHRYEQALPDLNRALALNPLDTTTLRRRAVTHFYLDQVPQAQADIERAQVLDPTDLTIRQWVQRITRGNPQASRLLMECYQRKNAGDLTGAEQACQESLELAPDVWDIHFAQGILLGKRKRFGRARTAFERALELAPWDESVYGWLGWLDLKEGLWEACVTHLTRALANDPSAGAMYTQRAWCHGELGQVDAHDADLSEGCRRGDETACQVLQHKGFRATLGLASLGLLGLALGLFLFFRSRRGRVKTASSGTSSAISGGVDSS